MTANRRQNALRRQTARRRLLRVGLPVTATVVGWALVGQTLLGRGVGEGPLQVLGLTISGDADWFFRRFAFLVAAAGATAAWMLALRAPTSEGADSSTPRAGVAPVALAVAVLLSVHLPVGALVSLLGVGLFGAGVARFEHTTYDPMLALGAQLCALLAGVFAAFGVTQADSLLAGGSPSLATWTGLPVFPAPVPVALILATTLFVIGRFAGAVPSKRQGFRHLGLLMAALFVVVAFLIALLSSGRWEFDWYRKNAILLFAAILSVIALLRVLGAYRNMQWALDGDGVLAATLLVYAALGVGFGGSFLAVAIPGALFFATRGEKPARWARHGPGGLARRIRPLPWPKQRSRPAQPNPYGGAARDGGP